jgi:uncharacterized protein
MRNAVLTVGLGYAGLCALLFVFQRSMIYFPPGGSGTGEIARQVEGERAVIYFGGNAEDVAYSLEELAAAFPGQALYLMRYPGYGGRPGKPTEAGIVAEAEALYARVRAEHRKITLVGRSLGSGVAVRLAAEREVARLVLITPFDSLEGVAAEKLPWLPVRLLLRDKYQSWRYAPKVSAPTRIIAAERDEVIPRASAELLLTRFRPGVASYAMVRGAGHNNISGFAEYTRLLAGE